MSAGKKRDRKLTLSLTVKEVQLRAPGWLAFPEGCRTPAKFLVWRRSALHIMAKPFRSRSQAAHSYKLLNSHMEVTLFLAFMTPGRSCKKVPLRLPLISF